jgi:hypothetical protein
VRVATCLKKRGSVKKFLKNFSKKIFFFDFFKNVKM